MEEVDKIQSGIMTLLTSVLSPDTLAFFGSLGVWGWVGIGVVLLLVGVGSWFLVRWAKGRAKKAAERKTEEHRKELETKLPADQSRLERGSRSNLSKLREWLSSRKPSK
jgi:hypothetical protein